ncbi:MAG: tetratricopeptide repeat protein [Gemmatimonas sp.]
MLRPGALALLVALAGCAGQAIVPPVDVTSPKTRQIPGNYAATVHSGAWALKTTTDRSICGAWTFDTALDNSFENSVRTALKRVLEHVTFVPDLLTTQQLKARGFDAQIVVGQGDAQSSFTVPAYLLTGTAHGDVGLAVTVSIRAAAGTNVRETVSGRGQGRAQISYCSGIANAITAGAKNAIGTVTRGVVRAVRERLDVREAKAAPRPKARPKEQSEETASEDADQPAALDSTAPIAAANDEPIVAPPAIAAVAVSRPSPRGKAEALPSVEDAFQRGLDAAAGHGRRRNDAEAVRWFRIAAEQGYAPAENNLGYMYAEGRGVKRDDQQAVKWYRRAADRAYPPAQTSLAMMVSAGRGMPRNDLLALALYSAASGQGYAQATANVAQMYAEGRGIARDEGTAAFLLATSGETPRTGSGIFVDGE